MSKPSQAARALPRVLIVNKYYYPRGGDCVCAMATEQLLRQRGHEVAVFAMDYPDNVPSEWSDRFASRADFGGGIGQKLKAVRRTLGMGDIRRSFSRMLDDFRPDVVHLNNIHSYLSPVIAEIAHRRGARVVWTLHDYKLICPAYTCLRDGKVCQECFSGKLPVLRHKCMKGSLAASAVAWLEALKWSRSRLERCTDTFICPSEFMRQKMIEGGFDPAKLVTLCNFVDPAKLSKMARRLETERDDYYCYIGRLSHEKGLPTLLQAASLLPYNIKVAGTGPIEQELRERFQIFKNIEFVGFLDAAQVSELLARARFSVLPSEWYENNPLGLIESRCTGTPVAGARIGGIPELIDDNCGMTFESGNPEDLSRTLRQMWEHPFDYSRIQRTALQAFTPSAHYERLLQLYR